MTSVSAKFYFVYSSFNFSYFNNNLPNFSKLYDLPGSNNLPTASATNKPLLLNFSSVSIVSVLTYPALLSNKCLAPN